MLGVKLAPEQQQLHLHSKPLSHAFCLQQAISSAVRTQGWLKLVSILPPGFSVYFFNFCCLFTEVRQCHLQLPQDMLDKYTAYSSSPDILSEQMKAPSQLEDICDSSMPSSLPASVPASLSASPRFQAGTGTFGKASGAIRAWQAVGGMACTLGGGCWESSCSSALPLWVF